MRLWSNTRAYSSDFFDMAGLPLPSPSGRGQGVREGLANNSMTWSALPKVIWWSEAIAPPLLPLQKQSAKPTTSACACGYPGDENLRFCKNAGSDIQVMLAARRSLAKGCPDDHAGERLHIFYVVKRYTWRSLLGVFLHTL
jgi:hypothetical protein